MALIEWPQLLETEGLSKLFPTDVIERGRRIIKSLGSVGAYSHSQGIPAVRETVAKFIERRDGHPTEARNIYMTNGASDGVSRILEAIISSDNIGVSHQKSYQTMCRL
jgi:alanine transaminase